LSQAKTGAVRNERVVATVTINTIVLAAKAIISDAPKTIKISHNQVSLFLFGILFQAFGKRYWKSGVKTLE
jgi:hypothetical protein